MTRVKPALVAGVAVGILLGALLLVLRQPPPDPAVPDLDRMLEAGLVLRLSEIYQRFVVMPSLFGTPGIIY